MVTDFDSIVLHHKHRLTKTEKLQWPQGMTSIGLRQWRWSQLTKLLNSISLLVNGAHYIHHSDCWRDHLITPISRQQWWSQFYASLHDPGKVLLPILLRWPVENLPRVAVSSSSSSRSLRLYTCCRSTSSSRKSLVRTPGRGHRMPPRLGLASCCQWCRVTEPVGGGNGLVQ